MGQVQIHFIFVRYFNAIVSRSLHGLILQEQCGDRIDTMALHLRNANYF